MVTVEGLAELPVRELVRLVLLLHDENERLKAERAGEIPRRDVKAENVSPPAILDA